MESPFKADILKGKVALLTGGGSGIGFEISTQFGKHGASIAIMGRRRSVLDAAVSALKSLGIPVMNSIIFLVFSPFVLNYFSFRVWWQLLIEVLCLEEWKNKSIVLFWFSAVGFEGDVRKHDDAKRVVEATVKHFGKLDILVNAAAGNFLVSAEDLSPNGFKTVMDIDTVGTFTMCHEAIKYLKKDGPGRSSSSGGLVLNISATLHYTASWYQIHVSAAKAAIDALTRNLALEWGTDYDVRVNGLAPGPIGDTSGLSKLMPDEISYKTREHMPLFKLGEKWDIAMAAVYLASDAGKYINGSIVPIDGGLWLSSPRNLPKEAVRQVSRAVEKRSRAVGVPTSKL